MARSFAASQWDQSGRAGNACDADITLTSATRERVCVCVGTRSSLLSTTHLPRRPTSGRTSMTDRTITVAIAALVTALGGTPTEADAVVLILYDKLPSRAPSGVIEQVQIALAQVRDANVN